MSRVLIVLGVVLIFVVGVFFLFNTGDDLGGSVVKTNPPKHTSAPTNSPVSTTTSAPPATTPLPRPVETLPVETKPPKPEYADVTRGGTYESGDNVKFRGENGEIRNGRIENGKVTSSILSLIDEEDQTLLEYTQTNHPTYGHLELISYPQRGDVIMKQNGKELDVCLKYVKGYNFNNYIDVVFKPDRLHPKVLEKLTC